MDYKILFLIGLGNPVPQYSGTRHNIGAEILYQFAKKHLGVSSLSSSSFCNALERSGFSELFQKKTYCFFPQTYMNLSGDCVQRILAYYKISLDNVWIFHDEIELSPQDVRYKFSGGHRGHNGIRDIQNKCGGADFHRIRIGVGRPDDREELASYVLSKIPKQDVPDLQKVLTLIQECLSN